jgi:hypothetical protein
MVEDSLSKVFSYSACQRITCFLYGTRKFITVFTEAHHWTLSWATRNHFTSASPVSLRSIQMLSSHLRLGLRTSQPKCCKHFSPPHACYIGRPPYPPWFNILNDIRWRIQAIKFIIMQFSPWSVFLPFRSKFLNTLFSETLSLCSSLKVRNQDSHPSSTIGKITVLILFIRERREVKRFRTEW